MLKHALRVLLLRVLPGRLMPLFMAFQVIRALRARQKAKPDRPRRLVTADGQHEATV